MNTLKLAALWDPETGKYWNFRAEMLSELCLECLFDPMNAIKMPGVTKNYKMIYFKLEEYY